MPLSACAVSGASEPCTAFASMPSAKSARIVPGSAFWDPLRPSAHGFSGWRFHPSSARIITGPEIMKSTKSLKNGRSLVHSIELLGFQMRDR